ncbi:hypothetical protein CWO92_08435 [Heyndrickxia camelliae]|uniref:Uncharacterized protein n=1 Tax=Heyndrickxia camelliae TaxID=1707093 RepID=A0A2N3LM36_9BACI|nr:hypothetical protein CWO92_08435 [Heyndrickxia camelliae]
MGRGDRYLVPFFLKLGKRENRPCVFSRGNGVITFREMKKEFNCFPAIAGYYVKETLAGPAVSII